MKEPLTEVERKLAAFALYGCAMRSGPAFFGIVESIAEKIGIEDELVYYAKNWIDYASKNNKNAETAPTQDNSSK